MKNIKTFETFSMNEGLVTWIKNKLKRKKENSKNVKPVYVENFNKEDDDVIKELIGKLKDVEEVKELKITIPNRGNVVSVGNYSFFVSKETHKRMIDKVDELWKADADAGKSELVKRLKNR